MSGWRWKIRRLTAMQPGEIAIRVQRMLRDRAISAGVLRPYPLDADSCFTHAWNHEVRAVYERFLHRFPCSRYSHTHWREFISRAHSECAESIIQEAENVLAGKLRLFTFEVQTDVPPRWFCNYVQGGEWQAVPAHQIDYRRDDIAGGVRYCWELNRHGYFLTMAQAYLLTGDDRFAQRLLQDWLDWIARNPPRFGINWTSPLECALRLHTWCWSLWFLADYPGLDERALRLIMGSLWQQCAEVAMNLSIGSSANNHLIGEAAGMWLFANLFPTARLANRWKQVARKILEREIPRQITADGVSVEQAIHYQVFVMEMALHADGLARHLDKPFNEPFAQRLLASARFLQTLADCNGNIPHIGDSDDAEVLPFCPRRSHLEADIVDAVCALYEHSAPSTLKGAWLSCQPVDAGGQSRVKNPPLHSRLFAQGGYAVMRDEEGKRVAVVDCGELGWGTIAAHAHADALAVTLSIDGQPILVDAGTYCYHDEPVWRDAFRSTRYHNTVCVDDTDQSEMLGAFLWGARAKVKVRLWHTSDLCDLLCASHNGYRRIGCGEHIRWFLWLKPDIWLVVDEVEQSQGHRVVQNWLLSQTCALRMPGDRMQASDSNEAWIFAVTPVDVQQVYGAEAHRGGWISPAFGRKEPTRHLFLRRAEPNGRLATLIGQGPHEPKLILWEDKTDGWKLQIEYNGRFWLVGTTGSRCPWHFPEAMVEAKTVVATWTETPSSTLYEVIE